MHNWVNSIGVILALVLAVSAITGLPQRVNTSAAPAVIDSIASDAFRTGDCKFALSRESYDNRAHSFISMCWRVMLANQGVHKLSVVGYDGGPAGWLPGDRGGEIEPLQHTDGARVTLPFVIEGGEVRTLLVRYPMEIPEYVADIISKMPGFEAATVLPFTLEQADKVVRAEKCDLLGNRLQSPGGDGYEANSSTIRKFSTRGLHLRTGRNYVDIPLRYPWSTLWGEAAALEALAPAPTDTPADTPTPCQPRGAPPL